MRLAPIRIISTSAVATAAALLISGNVLAHDDKTTFVAEPATVAPGAGVAVSADLSTSGPVRLSLTGLDGSSREIGVVEQTHDGHFQVTLQIPVDLPDGEWNLQALVDGEVVGSTALEVAGAPLTEEEEGEIGRHEEDPLLVPLPSGWQASRSGPPQVTGTAGSGSQGRVDILPIGGLGVALLALLVIAGRVRHWSGGPSDRRR